MDPLPVTDNMNINAVQNTNNYRKISLYPPNVAPNTNNCESRPDTNNNTNNALLNCNNNNAYPANINSNNNVPPNVHPKELKIIPVDPTDDIKSVKLDVNNPDKKPAVEARYIFKKKKPEEVRSELFRQWIKNNKVNKKGKNKNYWKLDTDYICRYELCKAKTRYPIKVASRHMFAGGHLPKTSLYYKWKCENCLFLFSEQSIYDKHKKNPSRCLRNMEKNKICTKCHKRFQHNHNCRKYKE